MTEFPAEQNLDTQEQPEPLRVKHEHEDWSSLTGLKQETDDFVLTPSNSENTYSEPELKSEPRFLSLDAYIADSQARKGDRGKCLMQ